MGKAIHRNDPCHCGSARKYKKCCLGKDENEVHDAILDDRKLTKPPVKNILAAAGLMSEQLLTEGISKFKSRLYKM